MDEEKLHQITQMLHFINQLKLRHRIEIDKYAYVNLSDKAKHQKPIFMSPEGNVSVVKLRLGQHKFFALFQLQFQQLVTVVPKKEKWQRFLADWQYKQKIGKSRHRRPYKSNELMKERRIKLYRRRSPSNTKFFK